MINLDKKEMKSIDGGCFAWDAGWLIGNMFSYVGASAPAGMASASLEYGLHYAGGDKCTK